MGEEKKAPRVAPYLRFLFSDTDVNAQVFKKTTQISSSYKYHCNEIFSVGIIFFLFSSRSILFMYFSQIRVF